MSNAAPDPAEAEVTPDTGVGLDDEDIWGGDDGMASDIESKSTAEIRQQRSTFFHFLVICASKVGFVSFCVLS